MIPNGKPSKLIKTNISDQDGNHKLEEQQQQQYFDDELHHIKSQMISNPQWQALVNETGYLTNTAIPPQIQYALQQQLPFHQPQHGEAIVNTREFHPGMTLQQKRAADDAETPSALPEDEDEDEKPEDKKSGRRKIKIEYINDRSRRHITFSKRKFGIMKKAFELHTLTGTQVLLLVASETGHVYSYATDKLEPIIKSVDGQNLIQACLNTAEGHPSDILPVPLMQPQEHANESLYHQQSASASPSQQHYQNPDFDPNIIHSNDFLNKLWESNPALKQTIQQQLQSQQYRH